MTKVRESNSILPSIKDVNEALIKLDNAQDKFIILSFFNFYVDKVEDILNIKIEDVDFNKKTIKVGENIFQLDSQMEKIILNTINETRYYHVNLSNRSKDYYEFNMSSKYLIKTKPTIKNSQGTNPLTYNGLKSKFRVLSGVIGEYWTVSNLKTSGLLHRLKQIQKNWKQKDVEEYCNKNGIKVNIVRIYNMLKIL